MNIWFWSLKGLLLYDDVRHLQLEMVELRHRNIIPDTILFLEHAPVITRGRGLQWTGVSRPKHMPFPQLLPAHISFVESERGGDLTYHGPGQLVVYPICKLDGQGFGPHHQVAFYIRKLEQILVDELVSQGLPASTKKNATGVWLEEKKIASIGIAVRKWVTYHGMAINCMNDLQPFFLFSPCGFQPEVMTRLCDWIKQDDLWRERLEESILKRISRESKIQRLSLDEAKTLLKEHETLKASNST